MKNATTVLPASTPNNFASSLGGLDTFSPRLSQFLSGDDEHMVTGMTPRGIDGIGETPRVGGPDKSILQEAVIAAAKKVTDSGDGGGGNNSDTHNDDNDDDLKNVINMIMTPMGMMNSNSMTPMGMMNENSNSNDNQNDISDELDLDDYTRDLLLG